MKAVLAIAGLDSSGGAGLAQDVATISGIGLHPKVAAMAVTAQSLAVVHAVTPLVPELVQQQICAAFEDLVPSAVKIGMLGTGKIAAAVAKSLDELHAQNIVVDPVLASTTGALLLEEGAQDALFSLFRLAAVMTPNVPEAEKLLGQDISGRQGMEEAARVLSVAPELHARTRCPAGHIHAERAAKRHVQKLGAAAGRKERLVGGKDLLHERKLERIALGAERRLVVRCGVAEACRIYIGATLQGKVVAELHELIHCLLVVCKRQQDRRASSIDDCVGKAACHPLCRGQLSGTCAVGCFSSQRGAMPMSGRLDVWDMRVPSR